MANYQFRHGYYYMAGVDKPLILPTSTIISEVEDMGFRVLSVGECEKWGVRGQMPFPTGGNTCGDEYDWIGLAERTGPDQVIDLPSRVKWIQGWPKPTQWPPEPPQPGEPVPPVQPVPPPQPPAPPYIAPPTPMEDKGNGVPSGVEEAAVVSEVDWRIPMAVAGGFGGLLLARWWHGRKR